MSDLVRALQHLPTNEQEIVPYLDTVVEQLRRERDPRPFFPHVFALFERYPDVDMGMPGPLVHFLEDYYPEYVDELIVSLERQPTYHAVWMLNRVLNSGLDDPREEEMLTLLRAMPQHPRASDLCRETAATFLSLRGEEAT